jgi:5-methylcytosine-specific restriction endonuclease McrBC regulatory subunit McrC
MPIREALRVPERGTLELTDAQWSMLDPDPDFWTLVDKGILSCGRTRHGVKLVGGAYVGRAALGAIDLTLVEKVDGALSSLLAFATGSAFRVERMHAPASELGPLISLLVHHFVAAVRRYASKGRDWHYGTRHETGSLIGGRINVTRTMQLRARGLRQLVAFDRPVQTFATPINRLISATLAEVDRINVIVGLPPEHVADSRAMAVLFADSRDAETLFGDRQQLVRLAEELRRESRDDTRIDILEFAAVLLSHQSFDDSVFSGHYAPRAWFLDLEMLFESAVRQVLRDLLRPTFRVENGRSAPLPIFSATPAAFRANPDLVIRSDDIVRAVGDAKYKVWDADPGDRRDMYQLLVHAGTFGARTAFLIYVGNPFQHSDLGPTVEGIRTVRFCVDPRSLRDHLTLAVGVLALQSP